MPPSAPKKRKASSARVATNSSLSKKVSKPKAYSAREKATSNRTLHKRKSVASNSKSRKKSKKEAIEDKDEDEDEDEYEDIEDKDEEIYDVDDEKEDDILDKTIHTQDHVQLQRVKDYLKWLEASPGDDSEENIRETKAAIKFLTDKINIVNPNVVMNSKIEKLKKSLSDKDIFLKRIFASDTAAKPGTLKQLTTYIDDHINCMWKSETDDKKWYEECMLLQVTVCANLKNKNYQKAYKNLTTPLYMKLKTENYTQFGDLLKEFMAFIESADSKFAINKDYAKKHVVISDLVWVIFMNTGLWRQLFKDGHKMLTLHGIPGNINSVAKLNAQKTHIDNGSSSSSTEKHIPCPGCSRHILTKTTKTLKNEKINTTISKNPNIGSAADHTNPVAHAFTECSINALKINLVMICQTCNSAKLNTHFIKFFIWLQNNKTKPLYNLVRDKHIQHTMKHGFGDARLNFYEKIEHQMIEAGVLELSAMFKRAEEIKNVYTTNLILLETSTQKYVEHILGAVILVDVGNPERTGDKLLYVDLINTLFGMIIGVKKIRSLTDEQVLTELFYEISSPQQQQVITRNNLEEFFKQSKDSIIFNYIPNIKGQTFEFFAGKLADHLFNEIKSKSTSTSAESISPEEFAVYFRNFIKQESTKVKKFGDAGKIKNLSKKTRKSRAHKLVFNKTFKGKTFKGKTFKGKTFKGKTFKGKTFKGKV